LTFEPFALKPVIPFHGGPFEVIDYGAAEMVAGLSDVKLLLDIVGKAGSWLGQIIAQRKNEDEHRAALLLASAGILVAAMRTLDNSLRTIMRELNLFTSEWSQERREQFVQRVNEFANEEKILPVIRQYCEQLASVLYNAHVEEEDRKDAKEVLMCANGILSALGGSIVTPFVDASALREFLALVKRASTTEEVRLAVAQSDAVLAVVERDVLARADYAFGRLKGRILGQHSEMPDPGWSVALSGTSTGGFA
jgi:hypothetical protein